MKSETQNFSLNVNMITLKNGNMEQVSARNHTNRRTVLIGWPGAVCSVLAMFASAVEASVEEVYPLLQVVLVLSRHSLSHHLPFSKCPLQFITFESFQPAGGDNEVFRMSFKVP